MEKGQLIRGVERTVPWGARPRNPRGGWNAKGLPGCSHGAEAPASRAVVIYTGSEPGPCRTDKSTSGSNKPASPHR